MMDILYYRTISHCNLKISGWASLVVGVNQSQDPTTKIGSHDLIEDADP